MLLHTHFFHEFESKYKILPIMALFINPFSTNVSLMDEPGSWFLLAKCLKTPVGE